jgi:hypothetical protein
LVSAFDTNGYSGGSFNVGDFNNYLNVVLIKLSTQFDKCNYIPFLYLLDARLSSLSFISGTLAKVAMDIAQFYFLGA